MTVAKRVDQYGALVPPSVSPPPVVVRQLRSWIDWLGATVDPSRAVVVGPTAPWWFDRLADQWRDVPVAADLAQATQWVRQQTLPAQVVLVDGIRAVAGRGRDGAGFGGLAEVFGPDDRVLFIETVGVEVKPWQRSVLSATNPTLDLWRDGLTPVDTHRPLIAADDGAWQFVIGVARVTPPPASDLEDLDRKDRVGR